MTPRYTQALNLAARAHEGQRRKGTNMPYIIHPVAVAGLVATYGGDEDLQIAGLLHDVLEDGGPAFVGAVAQFGDRVLSVVQGCTDGMPDSAGKKAAWEARKVTYLQHLSTADDDTLLVSGCDKLHNATAILDDLREVGVAVFDRFSAGPERTLWYYQSLVQVFSAKRAPVAAALRDVVATILQIVEADARGAPSFVVPNERASR